jgi:MFS family permease
LNPRGSEQRLLLLARGLRGMADGMISLVLPAYLLTLGYGALETGLIATATLAGSAALTLAVGLYAHRADGRSLLIAASILMTATGIAFALFGDFWPLLLVALVGTLNPSAGDVSIFLPLEQAQLSGLAGASRRSAPRNGLSSPWRACSAWTPLPAASWCSRCSHCGCSIDSG